MIEVTSSSFDISPDGASNPSQTFPASLLHCWFSRHERGRQGSIQDGPDLDAAEWEHGSLDRAKYIIALF